MYTKEVTITLTAPNEQIGLEAEKCLNEIIESKDLGAIGLVVMKQAHKENFIARTSLNKKIAQYKKDNNLN